MSVSGADDIDRALEKLSGLDMKQAVADAIQLVRSAAVNNCSVNTGELRQSIFADVLIRLLAIQVRMQREMTSQLVLVLVHVQSAFPIRS